MSSPRLLLGFVVLTCATSVAHAKTLYVDGQIAATTCSTYASTTRSCSGGTALAYRTVAGAAAVAVAGDTVFLRGGTYAEGLAPAGGGTASLPLSFKAWPSETVTLTGTSGPAIQLIGVSYIVIEGLNVDNVGGWARLEDATYNVIRSCAFTRATIVGTTGGFKVVRGGYNHFTSNTFGDGNDNLVIQDSDHNVLEANSVNKARHSLLSIRCGNFNVVRGNSFSNPDQKDLEIFDCEAVSDAPYKLNATHRNLIEHNVIADTLASAQDYRWNAIQLGGQQGIYRFNVFKNNLGGGINFQSYADESLYNWGNRAYQNTFYANHCYAVRGVTGAASQYYDNRVRNNLLYRNADCSGGGAQYAIDDSSRVIFADNQVLTSSPGFVSEGSGDFHLLATSSIIDKGAFLTSTVGAGTGTRMVVADAGYFVDGFGIPGEVGDLVQLQGQTVTARIVAIDYTANALTLDATLSWTAGQKLTLPFRGLAPDPGAFEYEPAPTPAAAASYYTVTPCRLVDTRGPTGSSGGPALAANTDRGFPVTGRCGVPATATAVALNVTVTQGSAAGNLNLYPAGQAAPVTSSVNYGPGATRANSGVFLLSTAGQLAVLCRQASGSAHVLLDVAGYFQ
jgi:hypothetical protein